MTHLLARCTRLLGVFTREARRHTGTFQEREQAAPLDALITPREREVLRLLVAGASNGEIAAELVISLATVKKHVINVLGKLGVQNRVQLLARAHEWPDRA